MTRHLFTPADHGRGVRCRVGDEVVFTVPDNPTTGYRWDVTVAGALRLVDSTYTPSQPMAVGSGGQREVVLVAVAPGSGSVTLRHAQPWESDDSLAEEVTLAVTVEE